MNSTNAICHSLLGALIADAAAMGLHWIYDVERLDHIARQHKGQVAFIPPNPQHYEGVPSYFAHAKRCNGMQTQYGETLLLAVKSIVQHGSFEVAHYQQAFANCFGSGGDYTGYIDRPTKAALHNIANEQLSPSGSDDDQHPAISTVPALVARYLNDEQLKSKILPAIHVTNVNDDATQYGWVFAQALRAVINGQSVTDSLRAAASEAADPIQTALLNALNSSDCNSISYGDITERACHLKQGMPLSFHIMNNASSYRHAVETNIKAGGDSAGRAIIIGALMGAKSGIEGENGIPLEWILSVENNVQLWQHCQKLSALQAATM